MYHSKAIRAFARFMTNAILVRSELVIEKIRVYETSQFDILILLLYIYTVHNAGAI